MLLFSFTFPRNLNLASYFAFLNQIYEEFIKYLLIAKVEESLFRVWKWLSLEKYQQLLSFLGPFVVPETIPTSVRSHLPVLQRPEYLLAD